MEQENPVVSKAEKLSNCRQIVIIAHALPMDWGDFIEKFTNNPESMNSSSNEVSDLNVTTIIEMELIGNA